MLSIACTLSSYHCTPETQHTSILSDVGHLVQLPASQATQQTSACCSAGAH